MSQTKTADTNNGTLLEGIQSLTLNVQTGAYTTAKHTKNAQGDTVIEKKEVAPWWPTEGPQEAYPGTPAKAQEDTKIKVPSTKEETERDKMWKAVRAQWASDSQEIKKARLAAYMRNLPGRFELAARGERKLNSPEEAIKKASSDRVLKWVRSQDSFIGSDASTVHSSPCSPATPTLTATLSSCPSSPDVTDGKAFYLK